MAEISIIMPVYNVEKYLKKSVESILSQTFTDFELLLINDGSTDGSGKICDEYAKIDNRVVVIHQENSGAPVARNAGIDAAKGNYITFVDSDDYIHPKMYEFLYDAIKKNGSDISVCDFKSINEYDGNFPEMEGYETEELSKQYMFDNMFVASSEIFVQVLWNKLYKRSVIGDERMTPGYVIDDFDFVYRLICRCEKIVHVKREMYYYMYNPQSVMNNRKYNPRKFLVLDVLYKIADDFRRGGSADAHERAAGAYLRYLFIAVYNTITERISQDCGEWTVYVKQHLKKGRKYIYTNKYIRPYFRLVLIAASISYGSVKMARDTIVAVKNLLKGKK